MQNEIFDLIIERNGATVTKIIKSGVVLWPREPHNAGMQEQDKIYTSRQEDLMAKERAWVSAGGQQFRRANDGMVGGNHYKSPDATGQCPHCHAAIEHWDWAHNLRALEYASTKYLARWRVKGGLESLKKVIHYVQKLIEIHFPDVVVTVQYANRAPPGGIVGAGIGGLKIEGCAGVAEGTAAHQAAVDWTRPIESPDYGADRFPSSGRDSY